MPLLEVQDLMKSFRSPEGDKQVVLDVPSFALERAEQVGLQGTSGSGKTTLLHVIAGILRPDTGRVVLAGTEVTALSESRRDAFRAQTVGYVFQTFNLLQGHTALENVLLGMMFGPGPDEAWARELLVRLGLANRMHHRPAQLSVGQQQRVALARALANRPKLVLADEPTGNLDPHHAGEAVELIQSACKDGGAALLLVSHDPVVLGRCERVIALESVNRALQNVEVGPG